MIFDKSNEKCTNNFSYAYGLKNTCRCCDYGGTRSLYEFLVIPANFEHNKLLSNLNLFMNVFKIFLR